MTPLGLFLISATLLGGVPFLLATLRSQFRAPLLAAWIAAMVVMGGLLGAVHTLPLGGGVVLLSGQVYYGSFILTTLLAVIVGRDVQVVRTIIAVVVVVDLAAVVALQLSHAALETSGVTNVYGVPSAFFDASRVQQISGAALSVVELIALLAVLEWAKARLGSRSMIPVYPLTFLAILVFDGMLFPLLVLRPTSGLADVMIEGVQGKLVLALAYSVPLLAFVLVNRRTLELFEDRQIGLRHLTHLSRDVLLSELEEQKSKLAASTEVAGRASATTARILDAATNTLLVATDPDLVVTHFNTGAEEILGRSASDVLGRPLSVLLTESDLHHHAQILGVPPHLPTVVKAQAETNTSRDVDLRRGDGARTVLSLSITEIISGDHQVGYLLVGEDVTGRLRAEAAIRVALTDEQEARSRLQEADKVKQQLVSTVSHELRTPLASMRGYLELLKAGDFDELSPQQTTAVDRILRNAARLERLVNNLLLLERAEAGPLVRNRRTLDLRDVVSSCADLLKEQSRDRNLVLELPDESVSITGDPEALQRVVLNLVDNAVKFTPPDGNVTVRLTHRPRGARLEVVDNGIGISLSDQDKLFTRFFRSEAAMAMQAKGTGLGLSIVDAIVTDHNGRIRVDSAVDVGTTVTVDLPA
ncbi:PAS domain-containing sensor histidine kinase [Nocardioides piscis]|uniref:Sensor-like histidine kinase SenX3 n=1 Tax=Nocardioides piscis TaxID=2714938 RepID=A0A6G7YHH7_9ACTN|nr:ATP-binding protein [Nocardioides piscis]QIK76262.1 PAS domain S-box protein [Nocardioides piscis]